jgi:site-specific DNA-methyltransferase (adenine-specific)
MSTTTDNAEIGSADIAAAPLAREAGPGRSGGTLDTVQVADCIEFMATLPDACIDAVISDLPYGTTACKWDTVIPFASLWAAWKRLLKPNGAIVLTASQPFTSALVMSNPRMFKYDWVWSKNQPSGIATAKHRPMKSHEDILVFCAGKTTYNKQPTRSKITDRKLGGSNGRFWDKTPVGVTGMKPKKTSNPENLLLENVNPRTVLEFSIPPNALGKLHPTQKPLPLMRYLVRTYTNPGEVVLDMCCGSGTTLLAAKQEGRHYIGCDREAKYVEIARGRFASEFFLGGVGAEQAGDAGHVELARHRLETELPFA